MPKGCHRQSNESSTISENIDVIPMPRDRWLLGRFILSPVTLFYETVRAERFGASLNRCGAHALRHHHSCFEQDAWSDRVLVYPPCETDLVSHLRTHPTWASRFEPGDWPIGSARRRLLPARVRRWRHTSGVSPTGGPEDRSFKKLASITNAINSPPGRGRFQRRRVAPLNS